MLVIFWQTPQVSLQHAITRNISVFIAPSTDKGSYKSKRRQQERDRVKQGGLVCARGVTMDTWEKHEARENGWTRGRRTDRRTDREGGKRGRFAYAYKICRGRAISRPIAWKTHAKISILGHLACNLIKQDQRLDLTIGITGRVERSAVEFRAWTPSCASEGAHTYAAPRTLRNVVYMHTDRFTHADV